jgi:hypothetical protein
MPHELIDQRRQRAAADEVSRQPRHLCDRRARVRQVIETNDTLEVRFRAEPSDRRAAPG